MGGWGAFPSSLRTIHCPLSPIPCLFTLLRTLLQLSKSQLFSFHGIAPSSTKTPGGEVLSPASVVPIASKTTNWAQVAGNQPQITNPAFRGTPIMCHESTAPVSERVSSFLTKNLELTTETLQSHEEDQQGARKFFPVTRLMTRNARRLFGRRFAFADAAVAALALLKFHQRFQ